MEKGGYRRIRIWKEENVEEGGHWKSRILNEGDIQRI